MTPEPATVPTPLIEDHVLIGDTQTAALVCSNGDIDWLCLPRFDSPACFAALVGTPDNGHWQIAPTDAAAFTSSQAYVDDSLIAVTTFTSEDAQIRVIDSMPVRDEAPDLVRIVEGVRGTTQMHMELVMRLDMGHTIPWVRATEDGLVAIAGPNALHLHTPVDVYGEDLATAADFAVGPGDRVPFVLTWHPSHLDEPHSVDPEEQLQATTEHWQQWADRCTVDGRLGDLIRRSLLTLKALTYAPTGGIVAAPTTSLPEHIGGVRNWDYRYTWLRDATLTLLALLQAGYREEAVAWRTWLLRAAAGSPDQLQVMYGVAGERHLMEWEVDWLQGYEASVPVRVGNAASEQFQLDVYGEVMDCLHQARMDGVRDDADAWALQRAIVDHVIEHWQDPDDGIWEVRGGRRHFTHSKVMAWVALDRAVRAVEDCGLDGPVDHWRTVRAAIHADVCDQGWQADRGERHAAFTQYYGADHLDASILVLPLVGFLPADDQRMLSTVAAVQEELLHDGFVLRYAGDGLGDVDGLPGTEGAFLPCSFWLADNLVLQGRVDEGRALFDRLVDVANDVGLLAEEYDPVARRQLGNFPQAFTHLALVTTAHNLFHADGPAQRRSRRDGAPNPTRTG